MWLSARDTITYKITQSIIGLSNRQDDKKLLSEPCNSEVSNNNTLENICIRVRGQIKTNSSLNFLLFLISEVLIAFYLHLWIFVRVKRLLDSSGFGAFLHFSQFATNVLYEGYSRCSEISYSSWECYPINRSLLI